MMGVFIKQTGRIGVDFIDF